MSGHQPIRPDAFSARAAARINASVPVIDADPAYRSAAVLVPVLAHPQDATVLLTRRARHLRDHAGQIAFPGGKMDASDPTPLETALRETEEEIGLAHRFIHPIGYLEPYLTTQGFRIFPVIAMVDPDHSLSLAPDEVESAFEVPLGFLMDPARHETRFREWQGRLWPTYVMEYGPHYIWGVTAGILRNLYERVYGE